MLVPTQSSQWSNTENEIISENDNEDESEQVFRKVIENLEPPIQNKENEEEKKMKQDWKVIKQNQ